jgi:hypothetical protein
MEAQTLPFVGVERAQVPGKDGQHRTDAGGAAEVNERPAVVRWPAEDVAGLEVAVRPARRVEHPQPLRDVHQHLRSSATKLRT